MTLNKARQRINQATDLANLLERLREVASQLDEQDRANLDLTSLPTFGGVAPSDTTGVWSWDSDSLLVGNCIKEMRLEVRD